MTAADDAFAYLQAHRSSLRPLVTVRCHSPRAHSVALVYRTRQGPFLWVPPVRWSSKRKTGSPVSMPYQRGLMNIDKPWGLEVSGWCDCGVQVIPQEQVWQATRDAMSDGKPQNLRAAPDERFWYRGHTDH